MIHIGHIQYRSDIREMRRRFYTHIRVWLYTPTCMVIRTYVYGYTHVWLYMRYTHVWLYIRTYVYSYTHIWIMHIFIRVLCAFFWLMFICTRKVLLSFCFTLNLPVPRFSTFYPLTLIFAIRLTSLLMSHTLVVIYDNDT